MSTQINSGAEHIIEEQFVAYLKNRKLVGIKGTFAETSTGCCMLVKEETRPLEKHFTSVKQKPSGVWMVRVSTNDYDNNNITDGLLSWPVSN